MLEPQNARFGPILGIDYLYRAEGGAPRAKGLKGLLAARSMRFWAGVRGWEVGRVKLGCRVATAAAPMATTVTTHND